MITFFTPTSSSMMDRIVLQLVTDHNVGTYCASLVCLTNCKDTQYDMDRFEQSPHQNAFDDGFCAHEKYIGSFAILPSTFVSLNVHSPRMNDCFDPPVAGDTVSVYYSTNSAYTGSVITSSTSSGSQFFPLEKTSDMISCSGGVTVSWSLSNSSCSITYTVSAATRYINEYGRRNHMRTCNGSITVSGDLVHLAAGQAIYGSGLISFKNRYEYGLSEYSSTKNYTRLGMSRNGLLPPCGRGDTTTWQDYKRLPYGLILYPPVAIQGPVGLWDSLCSEAVNSADYSDCNLIALVSDFCSLKGSITEKVESLRSLARISKMDISKTSIKQLLQWEASADLSTRYGENLTISDSRAVLEGLQRFIYDCRHGLGRTKKIRSSYVMTGSDWMGPYTVEYHYLAYISPDKDLNGMLLLQQWDLWPSLGNMWDLIPLSFAIDWLVDFGSTWEQIDTNVKYDYFNLRGVVKSYKFVQAVDARVLYPTVSGLGNHPKVVGSLTRSYYHRWLDNKFDVGSPSFGLGSIPSGGPLHLKELYSLIIQRL